MKLEAVSSGWLGTACAAFFAITGVTGGVLLFLYVPSVERAYGSVKDIEHVVAHGAWLRGTHRAAAHLMVIAVVLHLGKVPPATPALVLLGLRHRQRIALRH